MAVFNIINGNCYILSHSLPVDEPVNTLTLEHNNKIELEVINSSLGVVNENIISLINFNPKLLLDLILDKNIDTICFKTNTKIIREKLDIEKNLFKELDFIFALRDANYPKPGSACAFTSVYNDTVFLSHWIKYYEKIVGKENLYVIDHGSSILYDTTQANFIKIPRGKYDNSNMSLFCGYFQRFLLTQYNWVIHTDCDEFIFIEDDNDFSKIFNYSSGLVAASHGYEVIYNPKTEKSLDHNLPLLSQRSLMFHGSSYQKVYITSSQATWGPGFHKIYENSIHNSKLWALHIKYIDDKAFVEKNKNIWKSIEQTNSDVTIFNIKKTDSVYTFDKKEQIDSWLSGLIEKTISIPEWMKKLL